MNCLIKIREHYCRLKHCVISIWKCATQRDYFCLQQCVCEVDAKSKETASSDNARQRLITAAVLSVVFMVITNLSVLIWIMSLIVSSLKVIELTGGYLADSLAIMSDAAHLVTDSLSWPEHDLSNDLLNEFHISGLTFVIGAAGITWARSQPDAKMNFGYQRIEVFCAMVSIAGIWVLSLFISYFAVHRLLNLNSFEIETNTMLAVSVIGVLVNIV